MPNILYQRRLNRGALDGDYGWLTWELVAQSCLTLWDPVDCRPPGPSVHGILQARILEWVAISFSRGSFWLRDWIQVSHIVGRFFTVWATREAQARAERRDIVLSYTHHFLAHPDTCLVFRRYLKPALYWIENLFMPLQNDYRLRNWGRSDKHL